MKFISFSNEYIINLYLNQLSVNYNCLHFKKINDIINDFIINPFLNKTIKNIKLMLIYFIVNIKLISLNYHVKIMF